MNILDILIIIFLALWVIRGFISGFSITVTTLAGLICGIAGAMIFSPHVAVLMDGYIKNQLIRELIAYFLIFFIITTVFRILGIVLRKTLLKYKLKDIDSYMGALISGIEGIILVVVVVLLLVWAPWETTRKMVTESKSAPVFLYLSEVIISNLPDNIQDKIHEKMKKVDADEPEPEKSKKPVETDNVKHPDVA